jgi:chromosome segregation ATPase
MITDQTPTVSPEDLQKNYLRLRTDLDIVQNELEQALTVWRAILENEKQEFHKTLQERATVWDREETQWEKDRTAYEQKIEELEKSFHKHLTETEQNAVRALDELDGAWQKEREKWQATFEQQARAAQEQDQSRHQTYQQLEAQLANVQKENTLLNGRLDVMNNLETQLAGWQQEKAAWQQTFSERLRDMQQQQSLWADERQQKDSLIRSLQEDLVAMERRVHDAETTQRTQQQNLDDYVNSLETQIAALQEFITQIIPPAHPMRRKTDHLFMSPAGTEFSRVS